VTDRRFGLLALTERFALVFSVRRRSLFYALVVLEHVYPSNRTAGVHAGAASSRSPRTRVRIVGAAAIADDVGLETRTDGVVESAGAFRAGSETRLIFFLTRVSIRTPHETYHYTTNTSGDIEASSRYVLPYDSGSWGRS